MIDWRDFRAETNGAVLAAQRAGDERDRTLLLHYGATGSRDWWSDEFCSLLVQAGFEVIRYDPRDTGESTHWPAGEPGYTADDLDDDVIAVLNAAGVDRAVLVGLSMGGGIVQSVAARHPSRVSEIALLSTSPAFPVETELPPPTMSFDAGPADPDWRDRDAVIRWAIEGEKPYAGPGLLDEPGIRAAVGTTWDRDPDMSSAGNHFLAIEADTSRSVGAEDLLGVPGVVIHGSADALFPLPHGEALAEALDLPLVVLDGVGHQLPPRRDWPRVIEAIATLREA